MGEKNHIMFTGKYTCAEISSYHTFYNPVIVTQYHKVLKLLHLLLIFNCISKSICKILNSCFVSIFNIMGIHLLG